jgi:transcriptional regulator with XRE-family HTH domain
VAYRARFGEAVRPARERSGLSQEDLANKADMSRRYVGAIERGEAAPTLDRIALIASVTGVQPAELMPSL